MSSFFGLSIATSGLFASQQALNVTSHNVANANTEGYTRQRLDMKAYKPTVLPGGYGSLGMGVDVETVVQIRDEFLDFKYRSETSNLGEWSARADVLKNIESIFNEPSDSGIATVMDNFYNSLQELNKNPESISVRTLVRQSSITLTKSVGAMASSLKKLQRDMNFEFNVAVSDLNGYAEQIADLNKIIYETELSGGSANDIRDQRNVVLDKMSELAEIDYYEDNNGRFHVSVGGHKMVSHYRADMMVTKQRTEKVNENDAENLYDVTWPNGDAVNFSSGKIKGLMDVRDNMSGECKGIPYYLDRLNEFVDTMASELNRVHQKGYDLNGDSGTFFFTIDNMSTEEYKTYLLDKGLNGGPAEDVTSQIVTGITEDMTNEEIDVQINRNIGAFLRNNPQYEGKSVKMIGDKYYVTDKISADELTLASDLEDMNKIAASETLGGIPGDGGNILRMADSRHNVALYDWGSPDDYVKSLVSNLGVDAGESFRIRDNQQVMVNQVVINRESISGVSLDEEVSSMIKYQHAYNANARMINVMDEMLDLLVNRLGTVGR